MPIHIERVFILGNGTVNNSGELKRRSQGKVLRLDFRSLFIQYPQIATIIVFSIVFILFSVLSPAVFLSFKNMSNIWQQTAAISISAFGMTVVLLVGGIELSIGAIIAVVSVVCARMLEAGSSIPVTVAAAFGIGIAFGLFNGLLITRWKVQPFLITLGAMSIGRGLALIISGGQSVYLPDKTFGKIFATGTVFGLQSLILWTIASLIILYILISKTALGRRIQAIGGNEEAALNSGVNIKKVKITVYIISGMMASLSALIIISRLGSGLPTLGQGAEMDAIAAAVLGGTGFAGEGGNMFGTLLGSLVIGTIVNGLTILGVNSYIQQVVKGVIIILTVIGSIIMTSDKD